MKQSKKVLIIAYLFPPIGGGGVQRALKMAKYLGSFGWEPHILTVEPEYHVSLDHSLLNQLPDGVSIHRTREFSLGAPPAAANVTTVATKQQKPNRPSLKRSIKEKIFPILKQSKKYVLIP